MLRTGFSALCATPRHNFAAILVLHDCDRLLSLLPAPQGTAFLTSQHAAVATAAAGSKHPLHQWLLRQLSSKSFNTVLRQFSSSTSSMDSKKLINEPGSVVTDAIDGFLATHPHLKRLDGFPDIKVGMEGIIST